MAGLHLTQALPVSRRVATGRYGVVAFGAHQSGQHLLSVSQRQANDFDAK